jgi:4-hydroxy-3-methylbut-2-en-1-yl diphosphate synthase IspG/GcpE
LVEMPADTVVLARRIDETKTRMISISLMGSIVTGLGETYIKAFFRSLVRNKIKELIFTKF